jgi:hypothetical protein
VERIAPLSGAMTTTNNCRHAPRAKRAAEALARKPRCSHKEFGSALEPVDPRWLKFISETVDAIS